MKQRKLVISVENENGQVVFSKDPAHPDHVAPTLALYSEVGNTITIKVVEFEPAAQSGVDN